MHSRPPSEETPAERVVSEAVALCASGYDGPFMGVEVEALCQAVSAYERHTLRCLRAAYMDGFEDGESHAQVPTKYPAAAEAWETSQTKRETP